MNLSGPQKEVWKKKEEEEEEEEIRHHHHTRVFSSSSRSQSLGETPKVKQAAAAPKQENH